jgi:cytochrome P450
MEACRRAHGEVFTVRLASLGSVVFVADPDAIRRVFAGDPDRQDIGEGNRVLEPVVGTRSVLLLDGSEHLRHRRLMLPPFHGDRLRTYAAIVREVAERDVASWPLGRPFALRPHMEAVTLEVIARAVFGAERSGAGLELHRALGRMLALVARSPLVALVPGLQRNLGPLSPWARFERARAEVDALVYAAIDERRGATEGIDVLSLLLRARDDQGRPMSDPEIRDELVTLLVAGHETTATALAWAFECLTRHPRQFARLEEEVAAGGTAYLDAVVKEVLRLRPVLSIAIRRLAAPLTVGPYTLPAGTRIAPCIYLTHRLERLYRDPAAFRPERFLEGAPESYAWIPFGGGTRRCLGAGFATMEMREVIATVARGARLRAAEAGPERPRRRGVTLAPAGDALAVLEQRL